ncbi:transcriptional regulator [Nocardia cyriacigeorgica]|uniref:Transcriptional regulator n=1 Tax=Nocardia cyriacigeorgica TaxID=135487 RepID=A0ABX0CPW7_9NOCA|nr:transcriptional regulator [Nocardia cyriacigeorgica]NEW57277.1 transcriptional regulator [Nocardia cyriacigeorgica]
MTHVSRSSLLALHAIRLGGFVDTRAVADRYDMPVGLAESHVRNFRERGWISGFRFGADSGWSLSESGRAENERQLADELSKCGALAFMEDAYRRFVPLNARLVRACTAWQLTILPDGSMQDNDHADAQRDRMILDELESLAAELVPLAVQLTERLARFSGYHTRFAAALSLAADNPDMVTGTEHDSAHRVWFELHEDLIATLGIDRTALPSSP